MKIGINGFGRIGRAVTRIALSEKRFEISAINTRATSPEMMEHLLRYDSVYAEFAANTSYDEKNIYINGTAIACLHTDSPEDITWEDYDVDVVIDSTGAFKTRETLVPHLGGSVKKVILTCPEKDASIPTVVLGVNDDQIDWKNEHIISNASCTTNCVSPVMKVLHDSFGVESCLFTTMHAYTNSQSLLDERGKSLTMARATPNNLIPTSTGAAKAVTKVMPELSGKLDGSALRVPIPAGSLTDMTMTFSKDTSINDIHETLQSASEEYMKGILGYAKRSLVSSDYIGSSYSSIVDPFLTQHIDNNLFKIFAWYDNEWGYSVRVCELVEKLNEYLYS